MANIKKDNNSVPCIAGVLDTDGSTVTQMEASPAGHVLAVCDGTTGADAGGTKAVHDANDERTLIAASSSDETPVSLYVDSSGQLLIKSS